MAADCNCSVAAARKRLRLAIATLIRRPLPIGLPDGDLVLLADGMWFTFRHKLWVLYDMALKPVTMDVAFLLDPIILPGKESGSGWRQALATIPAGISQRIRALVSDGFQGAKTIARRRQWLLQRCHYHLLAQLYNRLGRRKPGLPGQKVRLAVFAAVRIALATRCDARLVEMRRELALLADRSECPPRIAGIVRQFLRDGRLYRSHLSHPELRLPITVSTLESLHGRLRRLVSCVNNPKAALLRIRAFMRLQPRITCNHKQHQQI